MPVALITGSAKRIGKQMALFLAEIGYDIALHYHTSRVQALETCSQILDKGRRAEVFSADLSDWQQTEGLFTQAAASLGGISLLVNSASVFEHDRLGTLTQDRLDAHWKINCIAPLCLTRLFSCQDIEKLDNPLVLNILDEKLAKLDPDFLSYTLAKAGLGALTRMLAIELAPRIRINGIAPGATLRGEKESPARFAASLAGTLLQKSSTPEDLCQAMLFLLRTPSITGQTIVLDGGKTLL